MTDEKYIRIKVDSKGAESNVRRLDKTMTGAGATADKTTRSLDQFDRSVNKDKRRATRDVTAFSKSVKDSGKSADTSAFAVNRLAAAIASIVSARQLIDYADSWKIIEGQIRQVTTSQAELTRVTGQLFEMSQRTRTSFESTAELYKKLSKAGKGLGESQESMLEVTETINNLFVASGVSAETASNSIRQLGQAFDKGKLNGDEFVTVAEQAPGVLEAIMQATGRTKADLASMSEQGELTAELLINSLRAYSDEAEAAAATIEETFGQSITKARNNAIEFVGSSREITKALNSAGAAVVTISENFDVLSDLVVAAAALIGARYVGAIGVWIAATVRATKAQLLATTAVKGVNASLGVQASRATAASVAVNATKIAGRGLAAALGLVGGPVGAAALAAGAIATFALNSESATEAADKLTFSTDNLSYAHAKFAKLTLTDALEEQREKLEDLAEEETLYLQNFEKFGAGMNRNAKGQKKAVENIQRVRVEAEQTGKKIAELTEKMEALNNVLAGDSGAQPAPKKQAPQISEKDKKAAEKAANKAAADAARLQARKDDAARGLDFTVTSMAQETAAIEREMQNRADLDTAYGAILRSKRTSDADFAIAELNRQIEGEKFALDEQYIQRIEQLQTQQALALENDLLNREQKATLENEFQAQELALREMHQQSLTAIDQEGADARVELSRAEAAARISNTKALGGSLMSLGQSQSKGIFKVGQKLSLAMATASLPSAVIQSFQNGGGFPWGLAPAGAMLATGIKNIQQIKKAGSGLGAGGGGGSTPSISLPSGGGGASPRIPATQNDTQAAAQAQQRAVDVRVAPGLYTDVDVRRSLTDFARAFAGNDESVTIITQAQNDIGRRGGD